MNESIHNLNNFLNIYKAFVQLFMLGILKTCS